MSILTSPFLSRFNFTHLPSIVSVLIFGHLQKDCKFLPFISPQKSAIIAQWVVIVTNWPLLTEVLSSSTPSWNLFDTLKKSSCSNSWFLNLSCCCYCGNGSVSWKRIYHGLAIEMRLTWSQLFKPNISCNGLVKVMLSNSNDPYQHGQ